MSKDDYEELQLQYNQLQIDYDELQNEFDQLKKDTSDWLKYSEDQKAAKIAQAEADRIRAEQAAQAAKAEQEAKQKAEEEAAAKIAAEEAKKGYETGITFNNLARNPDDYMDKKVKFSGEVLQVIEYDDGTEIRLATAQTEYGIYLDDVIYLYIPSENINSRILDGDIITIYGVSKGLFTYTSTADLSITLPVIEVDKYDFISMD